MRSLVPSGRAGSRPQPRSARWRAAPALTRHDRWVTWPPNEHSCSLDDLVGAGEDRRGDRQAEGLRSFQIDHQLELVRLLDRQIGRLGAFEYLVDVGCGAPEKII